MWHRRTRTHTDGTSLFVPSVVALQVRTPEWRYAVWCGWRGEGLVADWSNCTLPELYDHRDDTALYDVNHFEYVNLAGDPAYTAVEAALRDTLQRAFQVNSHGLDTKKARP